MEIKVIAEATLALPPERATLTLELGFEGDDPEQPMAEATALVQRVAAEIQHMASLQPSPTTWSAVLPLGTRRWRPYNQDGTIMPVRYAASAPVKVKFRDFRALSAFAQRWGGQPGVTLGNVEWNLTQQTRKARAAEVLTQAVEAGRTRAATIAAAAGAGEVRFVRVSDPRDINGAHHKFAAMARGGADSDQGIDLAPEDVVIEESIRAVFLA